MNSNHKATKDTKAEADRLSNLIIGPALEVHRAVGPGLLESAYEECLAYELRARRLNFRRQIGVPLLYKGIRLDVGFRMDLLVEDLVVVEVKAVERLLPIHDAQLLTYLRTTGLWLGMLLHFNAPLLKLGVRRLVN